MFKELNNSDQVFTIAEVGQNHQGDFEGVFQEFGRKSRKPKEIRFPQSGSGTETGFVKKTRLFSCQNFEL